MLLCFCENLSDPKNWQTKYWQHIRCRNVIKSHKPSRSGATVFAILARLTTVTLAGWCTVNRINFDTNGIPIYPQEPNCTSRIQKARTPCYPPKMIHHINSCILLDTSLSPYIHYPFCASDLIKSLVKAPPRFSVFVGIHTKLFFFRASGLASFTHFVIINKCRSDERTNISLL